MGKAEPFLRVKNVFEGSFVLLWGREEQGFGEKSLLTLYSEDIHWLHKAHVHCIYWWNVDIVRTRSITFEQDDLIINKKEEE